MLLNGQEIEDFIDDGHIKNADKKCVKAGSLDLRMGSHIKMLKTSKNAINLGRGEVPEVPEFYEFDAYDKGANGEFAVIPGACFLASSIEEFYLPDWVCTDMCLRSTVGRSFLNHMNAGWGDAGFTGSNYTSGFYNVSPNTLILRPGMRLTQMQFYRIHPIVDRLNYSKEGKGRYNNEKGTIGNKGVS